MPATFTGHCRSADSLTRRVDVPLLRGGSGGIWFHGCWPVPGQGGSVRHGPAPLTGRAANGGVVRRAHRVRGDRETGVAGDQAGSARPGEATPAQEWALSSPRAPAQARGRRSLGLRREARAGRRPRFRCTWEPTSSSAGCRSGAGQPSAPRSCSRTLTPFCSCGTTAIVPGMLATRTPSAPIVAFMAASPLTSPEELVLSGGLFGWPLDLIFFTGTITLGLAAGRGDRPARAPRLARARPACAPPSGRTTPARPPPTLRIRTRQRRTAAHL